jgi:TPP-dependent pyruvate/acetoin dehydrogenase alpha subunit
MYDPQLYRDKQEIEEWKKRDSIATFQVRLQEQGLVTEEDLTHMEEDIATEVTRAVGFAEAGTWEPVEDLTKFVYSERAQA